MGRLYFSYSLNMLKFEKRENMSTTSFIEILEKRKEVLIEAVWHQKRNTSRLKRRFKK